MSPSTATRPTTAVAWKLRRPGDPDQRHHDQRHHQRPRPISVAVSTTKRHTGTLTNVTLRGNSAGLGGGIFHTGSAIGQILALKNSIVANSLTGGNLSPEFFSLSNITSSGFNLSSDNSCASYFNQASDQKNKPAQLGPLANNGGFTWSHLPLPPIVNGTGPIDNGSCPASLDERGVSRPQGLACDIGAVEYRQGELTPWLYLPLVEKEQSIFSLGHAENIGVPPTGTNLKPTRV